MEVICWGMLMAYLREQLSRNYCGGGEGEEKELVGFGGPQATIESVGLI